MTPASSTTNASDINDLNALSRLRLAAKNNDPAALRAAAKQFESLFTQMLLKSARQAKLADDPMGSEQVDFYQDMFDQQMAQQLSSGKGLGLAQMLVRQLQQASRVDASAKNDTSKAVVGATPVATAKSASMLSGAVSALPVSAQNFVNQILPQAEKAAAQLGVPARVIVAQAALETGWGAHVMRNADGTSSNNLFGVKAGASWSGARVSQNTTEYQNGSAHSEVAQFRSYSSLDEAFSDYTDFIKNHPRYAAALRSGGGYAQELQKAGYATDPAYAEKIGRIAGSQPLTTALAAAQTQIA